MFRLSSVFHAILQFMFMTVLYLECCNNVLNLNCGKKYEVNMWGDMAAENKRDHLSYIFSHKIQHRILFAGIPGSSFSNRYIYLLNLSD